MRYLFLLCLVMLVLPALAWADDIVTMPTANQLKAGQVDAAAYYLGLDLPSVKPQYVQYQTIYVGLTDRFELDAHRSDVDKDRTSTVLVGTYKVLAESPTTPDLVVGCRNLTGEQATNAPGVSDKSKDRSYFISAAKTFFLKPTAPGAPLLRAHLSLGTADWTLLGEKRHQGIFGGLQALLTPEIGAVAEYDGQDFITGFTYMPKNTGLALKAGGFGSHWWAGVALRKQMSF